MDSTRTYPGPQANPGTRPETPSNEAKAARKRIPMSVPRQRLQVEAQAIPGYHLHWALESNIHLYLQAGYEFVDSSEVVVNCRSVGTHNGNADLGTRIRVLAGPGEKGEGEFHVLMKIQEEFFQEDQQLLSDRNASALSAIFRGETIVSPQNEDNSQRYVDKERTKGSGPLFQRHRPKVT